MKIWRTMMSTDSSGKIFICETIEYQGGLWLVPHWVASHAERWKSPVRIIRMDTLKHQSMKDTEYPADFVLNNPVPSAVLGGVSVESGGVRYEVIESPEIKVPLPDPNVH